MAVEPITRESFAPFGTLLSPHGAGKVAPDIYDGKIEAFHPGLFEADIPVEFVVARLGIRPYTVIWLERHVKLTQTFIPMGGDPIVMVVARPDARLENDVPSPDEVRAFLIPGDAAINLHRLTWHEPPFPIVDGTLILVTHHLTTPEDRKHLPLPDHDRREFAKRANTRLRLELP